MVTVKRSGNLKSIKKALNDIDTKKVEIGIFETSTYPNGTPVAYIAAIQEFGYAGGNIPPRPFFRTTIQSNKDAWGRQIAGAAQGTINGGVDFENALNAIGGMAAGDVSKTISKITDPPLEPSTLRARASRKKTPGISTKPLVDTGLMLQSITHKVSKK